MDLGSTPMRSRRQDTMERTGGKEPLRTILNETIKI